MKSKNMDVVKSNALIEACYSPGSTWRMRLLIACLQQIKAKEDLDQRRNFIVMANSLPDLTGDKASNCYRELRKASKELTKMVITVNRAPDDTQDSWDEKDINVTSSCRYYKNEGKVSLRFNEEILPYISGLKTRFTKYNAKYVMPMKSSYGIRLYELCLQWLGNEREFTVDEFRRILGLEKKYSSIKDLKKRVVFKAIDDINKHTDIRVEFGQRKAGRIVTHFQFMIVKKLVTKEKKLVHDKWISTYQKARPGESWPEARLRTKSEYLDYKSSVK